MKITIKSLTEEASDKHDYGQICVIEIDGKEVISFVDGDSPEDNNLSRSFSGVYEIPKLMKLAYEAGLNKEEFIVEDLEVEEY